jgi:hypothetical protein
VQEGVEYRAYPSPTNFCNEIAENYDEDWIPTEVQPHQEDHDHGHVDGEQGQERSVVVVDDDADRDSRRRQPWKDTFLRHYLLSYRWRFGRDPGPQPDGGGGDDTNADPSEPVVVRVVVAGMKSSGKSHFLRTLAPDQQVHRPRQDEMLDSGCALMHQRVVQVEDRGVNVVLVSSNDGRKVALLEMRRPNGSS